MPAHSHPTHPALLTHVDIAIVGGGPVGAALACGLEDLGLKVAVLEARSKLEAPDPRAIALSEGSRLILQRLGAWDALAPRATAIETIHVSHRGGFGRAELKATAMGVPALGYVAEYGDLYAALARRMAHSGATVLTGARVTRAGATGAYGMVGYEKDGAEHLLTANLVVLSEGGKALPPDLRQDKDYGQSALVCTVRTRQPHRRRAYERFTPEGPIALLPLGEPPSPASGGGAEGEGDGEGHTYALVWTTPANQVEARLALGDAEFLAQLQIAFGDRQGAFLSAGPRAAFPLKLSLAKESASPRLVRVGNAAHVLHPVAGQGFNLGLRDAWKLAEAIADHLNQSSPDTLGQAPLAGYARQRQADILGGSLMTDILVAGFSNDLPGLRQARGLALTALDLLPPLKTQFARKMMFGAQSW
ncbi:MAG: FAD-dependent monooxygenase [Pseudomonadota bacterium]